MAARPDGAVRERDFELVEAPVPTPGAGEFLVRTLYLSLAPVMRQYMIDGAGIEAPLGIGDVIHGRGVGQVVRSNHPDYAVGDLVHGKLGWREYAVSDGAPDKLTFKVHATDLPPSTALGVLGITGFSAYVGMLDLAGPRPGETVLVSGAAGGVGSIAGQLARIAGARVIGIAGSAEKCAILTERLGLHAAIDYRSGGLAGAIAAAAPTGIDVMFDNVGGPILDAALEHINRHARVISCGRISQYVDGPNYALANWWRIGARRARLEGFFVYEHADRFREAEARMAQWIRDGALTWLEDVLDGFEQMPAALMRLFEGRNIGKQLVRVADPLAREALGG
jgi:NADPH-dependent curcumin reductase